MPVVNLSEELIKLARKYAKIYNRSIPKQIEHWANIGKVIEEDKDIKYLDVKEMLIKERNSK